MTERKDGRMNEWGRERIEREQAKGRSMEAEQNQTISQSCILSTLKGSYNNR